MQSRTSSNLVVAATAAYGAALAIGIAPLLQRRAAAADLPGALQAQGLSPSGPMLQFIALVLLVFVGAIAGWRVARRIHEVRWAAMAYSVTLIAAFVPLMYFGNLRHVVQLGVLGVAIVVTAYRVNPRFSIDDVVLLPALLSVYFAYLDIGFGRTVASTFVRAAITIFILRLAVASFSGMRRPALAFALAPLALLLQMQWMAKSTSGLLALVWIFGTTIALLFRPAWEERLRRTLGYVVYPIALAAYALALLGIHTTPHVDFFEDGHNLLPAAEMLRGERPFADVIPMHGFLSDGGIDAVVLRLGNDSIGADLRARRAIGCLNVVAMYALTLAATGSAPLSCLAILLGYALFPSATIWLRSIPALFGLAACVAAVRHASSRWMIAAGAALAMTLLTSLDFAIYGAAVALFVIARSPERRQTLGAFGAGFASIFIPALIAFAVFGVADDFFRVSFQLLTRSSVYIMGPFAIPPALRSPTHIADSLTDPRLISALAWLAALIGSAVHFARSPLRQRRSDAVWLVALWMVVAGASWIERRHTYYDFAVATFIVLMLMRSRKALVPLTLFVILIARPFEHIFNVATPLRRNSVAAEPAPVTPRARGALFTPASSAGLVSARRYVDAKLQPDDTFFDFTNSGLVYYLLDRACPIAEPETALYQTAEAQRAVIAALAHDRSVRAVLITFPGGLSDIDGISNRVRAPLVWRYLEQNFVPDFAENGVTFWRRVR